MSLSKNYASFFREQKPLRYYANPAYYPYSIGKYASSLNGHSKTEFKQIGLNAFIHQNDIHRELIVLAIGETAMFYVSDQVSL